LVPEAPIVTVAILTYNGETYLEAILEKLEEQEFDGLFETLVIDSGSKDSTLDIIARHPNVRLIQIPNEEFGHGRTRNLAAQHAQGEFVAFLTHDAVPGSTHWLAELIDPFRRFPDVVAVLGKQVARSRSFPLQKYEIHSMFHSLGPDHGTTLFYNSPLIDDPLAIDAMGYYSDVNSAVRRNFLLDVIPYRDVRYAEDQIFGKEVIAGGYTKAYAPRAFVRHSNDLSLREYGHRIFDETVGLRQLGYELPAIGRFETLKHAVRGILGDSLRISRDKAYSWRRRLFWLCVNPAYHWRKWSSYRASTMLDLDDDGAIRAGSLEHRRKAHHERRTAS
jgi:rhamnosyltransferase